MIITNGTVSITDGNKASEDYGQNRIVRVDVTITGNAGEDITDLLDKAADNADVKVKVLLGRKVAASVEKLPSGKVEPVVAADPPKKSRAGKKAETLPPVETFPVGVEEAKPGKKAVDESLIEDDVLADLKPVQKIDLSDKALYDAVVAINAKISKPKEITAIAAKYNPNDGVPASLRRIPEDKRPAFMAELQKFAESVTKK